MIKNIKIRYKKNIFFFPKKCFSHDMTSFAKIFTYNLVSLLLEFLVFYANVNFKIVFFFKP